MLILVNICRFFFFGFSLINYSSYFFYNYLFFELVNGCAKHCGPFVFILILN
jgi:hypothetical protein